MHIQTQVETEVKRLNYSPDWNESFQFAVDTSLGDDQALAEDLKIRCTVAWPGVIGLISVVCPVAESAHRADDSHWPSYMPIPSMRADPVVCPSR